MEFNNKFFLFLKKYYLGILFIVGMFALGIYLTKDMGGLEFDDSLSLSDPTFQEPWSIHSEKIDFATDGKTKVIVKFLNTDNKDYDGIPTMICEVEDEEILLIPQVATDTVSPGSITEYYMIFDINENDYYFEAGQTYPCRFVACDNGQSACEATSDVISEKVFLMNAISK